MCKVAALALATALAAALAPAAASAATVAEGPGGALVYTGGAGSTSVDLGVTGDGRLRLSAGFDDPVDPSVPSSCTWTEDDPYLAVCDVPAALVVVLGDGDDAATVQEPVGVPLAVDGGDGADTLLGSIDGGDEALAGGAGPDGLNGRGGADVVDGGPGDDTVRGGAGPDTVLGGDGTDTLGGDDLGAVDADVLDGGPGHDTLLQEWSAVGREGRGPVAVTLDGGADDGFAGEGDDLRGVERVETSTAGAYTGTDGADVFAVGAEDTTVAARGGDDVVYASWGADAIDGGPGADELRGYGGDDRLAGGPGPDVLAGDTIGQSCTVLGCGIVSGNDVIDARDGERDSVDCGLGTDTALVDAADVAVNCEDVRGGGMALAATARGRGLVLRVAGARPGRTTATARLRGTVVARGGVRVRANGTGRGLLRRTAAGARRVRPGVTLRVRLAGATAKVRVG